MSAWDTIENAEPVETADWVTADWVAAHKEPVRRVGRKAPMPKQVRDEGRCRHGYEWGKSADCSGCVVERLTARAKAARAVRMQLRKAVRDEERLKRALYAAESVRISLEGRFEALVNGSENFGRGY